MAFIYKEMTEKDKEFFKSFGFKDPLSSCSMAIIPSHCVVNEKESIYLFCLGGQGHRFDREFPPTYFYLIYDEQPIKIETYRKGTGDKIKGRKIIWKIDRIVAPNTLKIEVNFLLNIVREVIETYERGIGKYILSIEFEKVANPRFVDGDVENG